MTIVRISWTVVHQVSAHCISITLWRDLYRALRAPWGLMPSKLVAKPFLMCGTLLSGEMCGCLPVHLLSAAATWCSVPVFRVKGGHPVCGLFLVTGPFWKSQMLSPNGATSHGQGVTATPPNVRSVLNLPSTAFIIPTCYRCLPASSYGLVIHSWAWKRKSVALGSRSRQQFLLKVICLIDYAWTLEHFYLYFI